VRVEWKIFRKKKSPNFVFPELCLRKLLYVPKKKERRHGPWGREDHIQERREASVKW
jgi:hypothetical protein